MNTAKNALMVVAIIQMVCGGVFAAIAAASPHVGLVLYVTLWVLDVVAGILMMVNEPAGSSHSGGAGPFSGMLVRVVVVAMLVQAIKAASKYRKLARQQQPDLPVVPA